jgi:hypothetical protein
MPMHVSERVRELRAEIDKLRTHGETCRYQKGLAADSEMQRIRLRLEEIKGELAQLLAPRQS